MKQIKLVHLLFMLTAIFALSFTLGSCNQNSSKKGVQKETTEPVDSEEFIEEDAWIIEEYQINEISLTTNTEKEEPESKAKVSTEKAEHKESAEKDDDDDVYEDYTVAVIDESLQKEDYQPSVISVKEAAIPLDNTKTVVAYTKKGKDKAALQVVSSSDGSVDQVVFYNKKHKDVYNVSVGMKGKEVKKLRKDMKHMVKDGKVFLYNDDSNIMYLMKAENEMGETVGKDASIDNMSVQAIIWKPTRKDLRKEKRELKKEEKGK